MRTNPWGIFALCIGILIVAMGAATMEPSEGFILGIQPTTESWYFSNWAVVVLFFTLILAYPIYVVYSIFFGKPGAAANSA
jgi:di/tricarboxylate transporter